MHVIKALCCATAITLLAAVGAHADDWNKRTFLTFSAPVQIPGATLPAGTYLFQLADPDNAQHVVMVASKDGTKIYGMFLTIPDYRVDTPDQNVVLFGESPAGAPQAVQAWWYPGNQSGEEFVYPKTQAIAIAKANHKRVLATEASANTTTADKDHMASLRQSKVGRVDENGNMNNDTANAPQTTTASNNAAPATTTAPANTVNGRDMNQSAKAQTTTASVGTAGRATGKRTTLPRTASSLELVELLSGLSLAIGFSLRRLRMSDAR